MSDTEELSDMALDEENLGERFQNQDLEDLLAEATGSDNGAESAAFLTHEDQPQSPTRPRGGMRLKPRWMRPGKGNAGRAKNNYDDVPESLLLEEPRDAVPALGGNSRRHSGTTHDRLPSPVPGPSTRSARRQWEATRAQQRLHDDAAEAPQPPTPHPAGSRGIIFADPKERAMWRWANVANLDQFLIEVYDYFVDHGIWSILLFRMLFLLRWAFFIAICVFLTQCIDYSLLRDRSSLQEVLVPKCMIRMHGFPNLALWLAAFFWVGKLLYYIYDIPRLRQLHDFYHHLLNIPDCDIQTVTWPTVVERLMALRDANLATAQHISPGVQRYAQKQIGLRSKARMDAVDIANRIMRKENYLIALFNKEILDLSVPIPFLGNRQFFSRTMHFYMQLCIIDLVFNAQGQLNPRWKEARNRKELTAMLNRRFVSVGIISIFYSPFYAILAVMNYIFDNIAEFRRNPSHLGSRTFTPMAEWKFREFNELPHFFVNRKNMALPYAARYLELFPKDKMDQLFGFVAFVASTMAGVLVLFTMLDSERALNFEIFPGQTVVLWLTVAMSVYAGAQGAIRDQDLDWVLSPEVLLEEIINHTHYYPPSWHSKLNTDEVRADFSVLYQMKIVIFLQEILSMIFCPFVLIYSLPKCSERIVDFFREFTIHVDGVGYVCSYAEFQPKRIERMGHGRQQGQQGREGGGLREDYYSARDGKMVASYYNFVGEYARRQGRGGHQGGPSARPHFHPPPAFPGIASSILGVDFNDPLRARHAQLMQSLYRGTPKFIPAAPLVSPVQSILLDPHHQPSLSGQRQSPQLQTQPRQRPPRQQAPEIQHPEEPGGEPLPDRNRSEASSTRIVEEESDVDDSWRTTRPGHDGVVDSEGEDGRDGAAGGGPGVLGLVLQFQKTQTEGGGANIRL